MLNIGGSLICLGFLDHPQVQQIETMFLHNCTSAKIKSELPHPGFCKGTAKHPIITGSKLSF